MKRAIIVLVSLLVVSNLISNTTKPVDAQEYGKIVFDYSHGQMNSNLVNTTDLWLANNLTDLGYTVVWAKGGTNSSVLEGAVGFVAGSIYGSGNGYTSSEISAIEDWYAEGNKFVWIGYDSDFSGAYINDNMTLILEAIDSHVYGEPLSVEDPESNAGAGYRPVATVTSDDAFVADIVENVDKVLMHGPTCLYGSDSDTPGEGVSPVALETENIENVYPFLYYSPDATIVNADLIDGYVHDEGDTGSFVASTIERNAGLTGDNVIVVSGASPYGDYRPMYESVYYDVELSENVVPQAIHFGIQTALGGITTTTDTNTDTTDGTTNTATNGEIGIMALLSNPIILLPLLALVVVVIAVGLKRRRPATPSETVTAESYIEQDDIEIRRGCEVIGGKFEYKVKVKNNSKYVINNVTVSILAYPDDCLEVAGSTSKTVKRIEPEGFRSPSFVFTPTKDCVEGQIVATVSFIDHENRARTKSVEPYVIRSVCDLLKPLDMTLESFESVLTDLSCSSEEITINWNAEILYDRIKALMPAKNFKVVDSDAETVGRQFIGKVKAVAKGKYTDKRVAIRIVITGSVEDEDSRIVIEALGDDMAMIPTTIDELVKGIDSWTCTKCGGQLKPEEVSGLKGGSTLECRYCGNTLTIDLFRK